MVAGILNTFEVKEGRRDEFLAVLAAAKTWAEDHGVAVRVRGTAIGGPESGRVSFTALHEDPAARGAYMDAVAADIANSPIGQMVSSADPPATPVSRVQFNEIGESSGIPDSAWLQMGFIFALGAGRRDEAESALEAAKERWAGLGVQSLNLRILLGGSAPGALVRVTTHDSWAAYEAAVAANAALDAPPPILAAVASGALTLISQSSSVEIDV